MGVHVTLGWISGSYTSECSFTVAYEDGDQITTASNLSASYSFSFDVNCAGDIPTPGPFDPVTDLEYTLDINDNTVTLTWEPVDEALSYLILKDDVELGQSSVNYFVDKEPSDQAYYCVIAKYLAGDSEGTCIEFTYPWGVNENTGNFRIYPNPVNNTLFIQGGDTEYEYVMFNGMGQQVAKGIGNGTKTINVNEMNKGVYFLRITTGGNVTTQKVVVE